MSAWAPAITAAAAVVTACTDASLRAALNGGGMITFDCDGTIVLTNTLLIQRDAFLDGSGHSVVISGNGAVRIFQVNSGVTFTAKALTIANGLHKGGTTAQMVPGGDGYGAGILNLTGTVCLVSCSLSNHLAQGGTGNSFDHGGQLALGAALLSLDGQVYLTNCLVVSNQVVAGNGGGIAGSGFGGALCTKGGLLSIHGCTLAFNSAIGGTLQNWQGRSGAAYGGGLYATATVVTVSRSLFASNSARGEGSLRSLDSVEVAGSAFGGGIAVASGRAEISNVVFRSNFAQGGGGNGNGLAGDGYGGAVDFSATGEIVDTQLSSNRVLGGSMGFPGRGLGGAIAARGKLTIANCALDNNEARGGDAAGSYAAGTNGCGGGIYNAGDSRATNITLIGNNTLGGNPDYSTRNPTIAPAGGGSGQGGAICVASGTLVCVHGTAFGNAAQGGYGETNRGLAQGGGIAVLGGTASLFNSILSSNLSGSNCFGMLMDGGNNISSDASCSWTQPGSHANTDPMLGALGDYGGPTPTMPLLAGSPAIDAALGVACAPFDQRGLARPYGAGCDIGAFESSPPYTIRGHIEGYLSSNITVSSGATVTSPDPRGLFTFRGLPPGTYAIVPSAQDAVFVLSNQVVNITADILNADFHSYRSNGWTIEGGGNNTFRAVLAGAAGAQYQLFCSTNLTDWSLISNSIIPSSGAVEVQQPVDQRAKFLKASIH